jgi:hypothetical protein
LNERRKDHLKCGMEARDGNPLYATVLSIPFEEFYMDPNMTLAWAAIQPLGSA